MSDELFMQRALALARDAAAFASPNPTVGCVLVRADRVLGEGAHFYDRRDHAEIAALQQASAAGEDVRGATAYVTLEPCCHHGRTGPCADALIAAGIARCVVATMDPNPQVMGAGVARMRAAGVMVEVGLCLAEARALNVGFACAMSRQRPFVTLKAALSVDGMLAPPPETRTQAAPHWLTGKEARAEVQRLRHEADAIVTGIGTVLADDPALTDRTGLPRRRPLQRIVLDRNLRMPLTARLLQEPEGLQVLGAPGEDGAALRALGVMVEQVASLDEVMALLHRQGVLRVLLEAGPGLNAAFLQAGLVDAVVLHFAATELGAGSLPFAAGGPTPFALEASMLTVSKRRLGEDVEVAGLLLNPWLM